MNDSRFSIVAVGDVRDCLREMPDDFVQVCITSPPYWGLRDYGVAGQLGSEKTVDEFVQNMVDVFREVKRILRPDGSLYLNLGDSYARNGGTAGGGNCELLHLEGIQKRMTKIPANAPFKAKDLVGTPWLVAFALRADGWYLREDIIWHKPNPMPESITDRCTRSHEYIFHLTKSPRYYYDHEAIKEPYADDSEQAYRTGKKYNGQAQKDYASAKAQNPSDSKRRMMESIANGTGRNKRDVWILPVQPYRDGHFATFPESIPETCILAASSEAGQCGTCDAVWTRVVEKEPIPQEIKDKFEAARQKTAKDTGRTDGNTSYKPNFRRESHAVGWVPTCDCGVDAVPQVVLDTFTGSGRTGIVARRLGRSFYGIELNPDYATQAVANIAA